MHKKYNIGICLTNPKDTYSGGRYFSITMAESLASAGHNVSYITNLIPIFYADFSYLKTHDTIGQYITADFIKNMPKKLDFLYVFPGTHAEYFYKNVIC